MAEGRNTAFEEVLRQHTEFLKFPIYNSLFPLVFALLGLLQHWKIQHSKDGPFVVFSSKKIQ